METMKSISALNTDTVEICYCADIYLKMFKEIKLIKDLKYPSDIESSKISEIEALYMLDMEKCRNLDDDKTENERKSMEYLFKKCDSYNELETLMKNN
jgi:hypothetical protein